MMLTNNQKELITKSLSKGRFASASLQKKIEAGNLDEESKNTFCSLMESYLIDVMKEMDYQSHLVDEHDSRYAEIRKVNQRATELERQLASKNPLSGFKEQFSLIQDTIHEWWRKEGFVYVKEVNVIYYGVLSVKFGFQLNMRSSMFSKDPEGDRADNLRHRKSLEDRGFEFAKNAKDEMFRKELLATDKNKALVTELIRQRFPSFKCNEFNTFEVDGMTLLHMVNGNINEITDVQ